MSHPCRLALSVIAACPILAGVLCAPPTWLADLGLDAGALSNGLQQLQQARQRQETLDRLSADIRTRIAAKQRLARDLIEHRRTVAEAVSQLRQLIEDQPNGWEWLRKVESGGTDEERLCQHLLGWANAQLRAKAKTAAEVIPRLEREMAEYLRQLKGLV